MIKVLVNGFKGRMGCECVNAVENDPELELVGKTDIGEDLETAVKEANADVVIDFTVPGTRMDNFKAIIRGGARPVVGTTGYTKEEIEELTALCFEKGRGAIIAPNFTIGAIVMMMMAKEASKYFDFAEIIEYHHNNKEDYPSGTAVKTAQLMAEEKAQFNADTNDKVAVVDGARGADMNGIKLHSVRMKGYVAHQEVIFGAMGQTLTIRHDSISREAYMPGVVMSCKKVMELDTLVYGLEHII